MAVFKHFAEIVDFFIKYGIINFMGSSFLKTKIKRTLWVSLLEQNSIVEAVSFYQKYKITLDVLLNNFPDKGIVEKEKENSQNIFKTLISKKGIENFENGNYTLACCCFASLAEISELSGDILKKYLFCLFELNQTDIAKDLLENYSDSENNLPEENKNLSDLFEKVCLYQKSCDYMEEYFNQQDIKSWKDYFSYARKLHCLYNETQELFNIEKSIEYYDTALALCGKNLYVSKDIDYNTADEILHKACSRLLEIGSVSYVYSDLITVFANVGMLDEQASCFEMLINSDDDNCSYLIKLFDRFKALSQIISYFNQYKMFEAVLYANEYFQKLEGIIISYINSHDDTDEDYKSKIINIKNNISYELSLNEYNMPINELAIELNENCEQAYLNILDDYIHSNDFDRAYELYDKYCNQFDRYKEDSIAKMLWQLSNLYHDMNLHFKSVKYQQCAVEYELEHGVAV